MGKEVERDRIRQLVAEVVEGQGYELVEFVLKGGGKNGILRVFIDRPAGISHQDCELVSEQLGTVLDVEDLIPFAYTLEVSSPGLDRKLVKDSDYTRFEGKLAKIQTRIALQNQKTFKGRLRGLQGSSILLEMPKGGLMEIPLDVIHEARLEFDWAEEMARARGVGEPAGSKEVAEGDVPKRPGRWARR
jgi:ribosome maturation factor RimP